MAPAFNTILIPVDFSENSEIAVKKAAELAGNGGAELHLMHVPRRGIDVDEEFEGLEGWIRARYPAMRVKKHVFRGRSVQQTIIGCAQLLCPDLIVIGKSEPPGRWGSFAGGLLPFGRVSPDVIAKQSNYPVLTVKPGSADNKTRVILIPIGNFLPERKLEWVVLLAKRYRAQVHLLAIQDVKESKEWALPQVFLKAYHQLREHLHRPIEYSATGRQGTAKAALKRAELIMADMIVVNPETESGVAGIGGYRHISDLLGRDSKIQVLDISPYEREAAL
jgi:nucleotide-binding universal stress UspA family protein